MLCAHQGQQLIVSEKFNVYTLTVYDKEDQKLR
jgi:hypothetical protein